MRWPVKYQIAVPMLLVMALALFAVAALAAYLAGRQVRSRVEAQLRSVARTLAEANFPLTDGVLASMRGLSGAEYAVVGADRTQVAASHEGLRSVTWPNLPPQDWRDITLDAERTVDGRTFFHASIHVKPRRSNQRPATLHILYPRDEYDRAWRRAVTPPLGVGAAALLLTLLAALVIAGRVTRPIAALRRAVRRIAEGHFEPVATRGPKDEIHDLTEDVNRMAAMLADYEARVRDTERLRSLEQLRRSVAHQLRNAVAGCQLALGLHQRRVAAEGRDDASDESLRVAVRQIKRMESYLQRFMTADPPPETRFADWNLGDVVARVLSLLRPPADHLGITLIEDRVPPPLTVHGVAEELEQVVTNLIMNALDAVAINPRPAVAGKAADIRPESPVEEYPSPSRPRVTIALRGENGQAILEVRDTGPGPPADIASTMFDPLVTGKPDGGGLGLYLAKQIVQRHHGDLTWRRESGETVFTVSLPTAPARSAKETLRTT